MILGYLSGVVANSYALAGLFNPESNRSDAIFSNPALISDNKFSGVIGVRQNYFMSELTDFHASLSTKIWRSNLALGVLKRGIKDVLSDYTFLLGSGYKTDHFGIGISGRIKYLFNLEDNLKATSISLDYGFFARWNIFNFSFSHLNALRSSLSFDGNSGKTPSELNFQASLRLPEPASWFFGVSYDGEKVYYRIGSEVWFTEGFGIRVGIQERDIRLGLGLKTERYGIDFAFGSSRELGTTVLISTNYNIF